MERTRVSVLFVEDSQLDVELALDALKRDGLEVRWERVDSEEGLAQALRASWPQAILSDYTIPGFDGLQALRIAREIAPRTPFIFVSGTIGEERAIEAIKLGATDYVLKDNLRRLGTALRRALNEAAERRAYEGRIEYLANYDAVTDLPNRRLLGDRTSQAITHARRTGRTCALLAIDCAGLRRFIDVYGHAAGDALLRAIAARLRAAVRDGDTVARLGADAYRVLAADLAHSEDAADVAAKLRDAMRAPLLVEGHETQVTASIGAAVFPRDGEDFDLLLRNADAAAHRVKEAGGDGFQFYTAAMTRDSAERADLEAGLRAALQGNELEMYLQPQVTLADGRITGVEALMRWRHPKHGAVPPARFIPIAEASELIHPLGEWALGESCRLVKSWNGYAPLRVAVNVSARQFRRAGFVETVARALRLAALEPSRLELELTESVLVHDQEEAIAILRDLKARGVRIAIDDFGTGYSSLAYLSRLPIDCLKIDRSFVHRATDDRHNAAIAQAVVSLGQVLGLRVVAEGVETAEQLEFLRARGCQEGQGYLFSPPRPAAALAPAIAAGALAAGGPFAAGQRPPT